MPTREEADLRVSRGAKLLDSLVPGWAHWIDPGLLKIESCTSCVLGQIFGSYMVGYREVVLPQLQPSTYFGFDITIGESRGLRRKNYQELTEAWLRAIADRVCGNVPSYTPLTVTLLKEEPVTI